MARLHLVRHGQAAAGWDAHPDPGLDDLGRAQARAMATSLATGLAPRPIVVSPLRRTRETAQALENEWGIAATVDPGVGELKAPTDDLQARTVWLRGFLTGRWAETTEVHGWRDGVVDALLGIAGDSVVVTHYIAINLAVGRATGDDRVVCFRPDHCSVTVVDNDGGRLALVSLGTEANTVVG